ncbi:helix-turn-helix domain-containing protein [Amphibacillus jilinensis]|uniref:helix-turn-helix domain-containing protein n=1 Tax=Amphibacillus jilinensis TaxID=1216008 RepID=UPI0002D69E74|nr:helix-turn-helix transcriptional regulator [Amphibacillus jilinensis]
MLKDRLVSLRKEKGLSQYEVADRLGFSRGKLANYEQGTRQPDYDTLNKIAEFYGVSADYLLGRTEKKQFEEDENLFFFDMEGLNEDEIADIKEHIEYVKWKSKQGKEE